MSMTTPGDRLIEALSAPCETCEGTGMHPPGDDGGFGCWDCGTLGIQLPSLGYVKDVLLPIARSLIEENESLLARIKELEDGR